jgi:hypothetical protein
MTYRMENLRVSHRGVLACERPTERVGADVPAQRRWRELPATPTGADADVGRVWRDSAGGYDSVDRRLIDTFPASDAVARY